MEKPKKKPTSFYVVLKSGKKKDIQIYNSGWNSCCDAWEAYLKQALMSEKEIEDIIIACDCDACCERLTRDTAKAIRAEMEKRYG